MSDYGLLNPLDAAIMALGTGLLSGGGPSRVPRSFGSILGEAGGGALQDYQQAARLNLQAQNIEGENRLREAQIQETLAQAKERQIKQAQFAAWQQHVANNPGMDIKGLLSSGIQSGLLNPSDAMTYQSKIAEIEANRASKEFEVEQNRKAREAAAIQANLDRLAQIRAAAALRPEPAPSITQIVDPRDTTRLISIDTRITNEGKIRSGDTKGIVGVSGKEPAAQKREEQKESGRRQLSDTVDSLASYYDNLERMGAVVNPEKSTLSNIWERFSASGPGQLVAGAVGTEAQTERDKINMARAGLMANMKQATGMSAQSLNSNAELMFYMNMATDPAKSIKANRAALAYLDKTFGLGLGIKSDPSAEAELAKIAPKSGKPTQPYVGPERRQPVFLDEPPPGAVRPR